MFQQVAIRKCMPTNACEPFWKHNLLQLMTVFKRFTWKDQDRTIDTNVSHITWNLGAKFIKEEWLVGRVACVTGHVIVGEKPFYSEGDAG